MGDVRRNLPQAKIADALDAIVQLIDPEGSSEVDGYKLPQKRIAAMLDRLARKIDEEGGIYAKVPTHICVSGEYSALTGEPTVENPEKDVFYLVPNGTTGDDMYEEWVYNGNRWEKFGTGGAMATSLAGLNDVRLENLTEGQALIYNGSRWSNGTVTGGENYTFSEGDVNGAFAVTTNGGDMQTVKIHGLREFCLGDEQDDVELVFNGGCIDD